MNRSKQAFLLVVMLVPIGCNMLKKTTRTKEEHTLEENMELRKSSARIQEKLTDTKFLTLRRDTAWGVYTVQLWPRGKFTYLPTGGFEGVFDSILVRGKIAKGSGYVSQNTVKEISKQKESSDSVLKTNKKSVESNRQIERIPDIKLILVISIVAIITLFYVIKRR
jgi:hypothetical protein